MRVLAGFVALAAAATPLGATAQSGPSGMPSYAVPDRAPNPNQETIRGHIAAIDDPNNFALNDDRGYVDNIQLQTGTIINPTGTRLLPGMVVTIVGAARGSVFAANIIDVYAGPPNPPQPPPPGMLPGSGAQLTGTLATALDSKSAYVGETVVLSDVASADGAILGATLTGKVIDVQHPGQGKTAQVQIHFDTLRLHDGTTQPIDGIVLSMNVKTKSNAVKEIGGALAGLIIGNVIGKTVFGGASGGGIIGAVGGFLVAQDNHSDVVIPANSSITVQLLAPRRQSS